MKLNINYLFLSLLAFLLSGCYAARITDSSAASPEAKLRENQQVNFSEEVSSLPTSRKLIYDATIGLIVPAPDSTLIMITAVAKEFDGYFNRLGPGAITIRVPASRLEEVLTRIEGMGKMKYKRLSGQDVTEEYLDYQIRLDNARKARQRYLELLSKATTVEETLLVERELERLAETIEIFLGKINRLDQLEELASITVNVEQKTKLGPLGAVGKGLYAGVKWLFVRN